MREEYHVAQLQLQFSQDRELLASFLTKNHLAYEADIQAAFGIFDETDALVACGCAAGPLLKCFAVEPELRGQNALGSLVSALVQERFAVGIYELFIITRSKNEAMFSNCGFFPVVCTEQLVLLENRSNGPQIFTASMRQPDDAGKSIGAVVMNCNPFTLGHQALVEYAASHCDVLHLFVVEENRSAFPTDVRLRLVQEGTSHLSNVRVHLSGHYMISSATFPTYFLKAGENAAILQSELDTTLFAQCIAPLLGISKRFVGQEPLDETTNCYNQTMKRILPQYNIEVYEIPRLEQAGEVISASRVRSLLKRRAWKKALALVPETTGQYLKEYFRMMPNELG